MTLDAKHLREILNYDPETGIFLWRARKLRSGQERIDKGWNTRFEGKPAGRPHRYGHLYINIKYRNYAAHRLAWLYVFGEWPERGIDHINGNPADNRISNLRLASQSENLQNACIRSDNTSGHRGVSWSKRERKWYSYINVKSRMIGLGKFKSLEDAIACRIAAENKYFGEFARRNSTSAAAGDSPTS